MAGTATQEDVFVRLSTLLPADEALASRNLKLTKQANTVLIGRASKRRSSLGAGPSNACYECPVMSRNHAELKLDSDKKRVLLRDIGSLHGTSLNKVRLKDEESRVLQNGDIITFGMPIDRGSERYTPYEVEAEITWHPSLPTGNTVTYRVPDETDIEDNSSDEYIGKGDMYKTKMKKQSLPPWASRSAQIDLTGNDDEVASATQNATTGPGFIDLTTAERSAHGDGEVDQGPPEEHSATLPVDSMLVGASAHTFNLDEVEDGTAPLIPGGPHGGIPLDWLEDDEDTSSLESSDEDDEPEYPEDEDVHDLESSLSYEEYEAEFDEHDDFEIDFEEEQPAKPPGSTVAEAIFGSQTAWETRRDSDQLQTDDEPHFNSMPSTDLSDKPREMPSIPPGATSAVDARMHHKPPPYTPRDYGMPMGFSSSIVTGAPPSTTLRNMVAINQGYVPHLSSMSQQDVVDPPSPARDSAAAVDALGKKSGKAEYFHAREENRRTLGFPSNSGKAGKGTIPTESDAQATSAISLDETLLEPSGDLSKELQDDLPNELAKSGASFLNTPLTQDMVPEIPPRPASPILDDSSAYQFELSKRAAAKEEVKNTEPPNAEKATTASPDTRPAPSPKRKADEISESTPEEERALMSSDTAKDKASQKPTTSQAVPAGSMKTQSELPRPAKRLRRAAEVFGYAALGGLAVVSALIATAPEL